MKHLAALAVAAALVGGIAAPVQAQALIGWTNAPAGTVALPDR
ncbi:MAG: hypothetical protein NW223_18810 [Hyphomicrobiaceae bacterium]|nr:hypothetical protein [Hyphomicrobiaceae bacterium]